MDTIKTQISSFVNSSEFWKWHGFTLSILWLIGSSIGIIVKKKDVRLHLLSFLVVDYTSLFFMGAALYLTLPKLFNFSSLILAEQIHIILGLIFMCTMTFQHIQGAVTWHKQTRSRRHRSLGQRLAIFGRIIATIGWIIHYQDNKYYAIATALASLALYFFVQRSQWAKIKVN